MSGGLLRLLPYTNRTFVVNQSFDQMPSPQQVRGQGLWSNDSHGDVLRVTTLRTPGLGSEDISCHVWQDAQHTIFQLANLCAAVSVLTPSSFRHHLLFLRCLLLASYVLLVLWAGLFVCMMDVLIWNCIFFCIDSAHIICLVHNNIPSRFNPNLNELYKKKFKPIKVSRREFAELCHLGSVVSMRKGSRYCVEKRTPCGEKVSILLRGRLKVSHDGQFLHLVHACEFVDSPEFDSVPFQTSDISDKYQVSICAVEESVLISWSYPVVRSFLASRPYLSAVLTNIIGKDISDKLYRIQELVQRDLEDIHSSSFQSHNSSLLSARKCLLLPDTGQHLGFTNGKIERQNCCLNQP